MNKDEILQLWKSGLSKQKVAVIYQRRYNQRIKLIRAELVNRHSGKLISYMEALSVVERIIYKEVKKTNDNRKKLEKRINTMIQATRRISKRDNCNNRRI